MKPHKLFGEVTAILILAFSYPSLAQGIKLGTNTLVSYATVEAARHLLTNRDEFVLALSPFDRAARMKTSREVAEPEFLEFVGRSVLAWLPEETNRVTTLLQTLQKRLAPWHLPLPSKVLLIKTSGAEEGVEKVEVSYTRQNAIIFTRKALGSSALNLEHVLTHELFHVLSRHNPDLRRRLYAIIGFTPINEITYPEALRARKITNPDGVQDGWAITLTNQGRVLPAVPILYASAAHYDPNRGGEFFDSFVFKLLAVTNQSGSWRAELVAGKPQLLDPEEPQGFFEQVGRNTDYILHPDEILAENFVKMVTGETNLPTPRIVMEMRKVFRQR